MNCDLLSMLLSIFQVLDDECFSHAYMRIFLCKLRRLSTLLQLFPQGGQADEFSAHLSSCQTWRMTSSFLGSPTQPPELVFQQGVYWLNTELGQRTVGYGALAGLLSDPEPSLIPQFIHL